MKQMNKDIFWELTWPSSSKMNILGEVLDDETLLRLIAHFRNRKQEDRIIRFPKNQTIEKMFAYYFGKKVEAEEMTWEEVMKKLKGTQRFLKDAGITRKNVKKLFAQRKFELLKEKKREK